MSAAPQTLRLRAGAGAFRRALAATLALSWPLVLANLAVNAMTATDYMMLGWLSPRALAAGALGFNLYQPAFLQGIGLVAALSPIASAQLGAGGDAAESLRRASQQAFLSALAIAAVTWIALVETTPFLAAIGELPDLARDAGTYMRGSIGGWRRTSCSSPGARCSPRSSGRGRRWSRGSLAWPSTRSPITRSCSANSACPRSASLAPGSRRRWRRR